MARYIDADALLAELDEELMYESTLHTEEHENYLKKGIRIAINDVKRFPTADVVPKSEVVLASSDAVKMLIECHGYALTHDADIKKEVAREFIEAVDSMIELVSAMIGLDIIVFGGKYAELKKKYTEGNDE